MAIYHMPGRGETYNYFKNKMLPFTADSGWDAVLCVAGIALLLQVDAVLKTEAQLAHGPIVPY